MAAPDLEVIKDIPGYKVILKAVLKSQIQQLVSCLPVISCYVLIIVDIYDFMYQFKEDFS